MRALIHLLVALALAAAASPGVAGSAPAPASHPARQGRGPLHRTCEWAGRLRLQRFEDGSARLECAGRVLVRVSVPG